MISGANENELEIANARADVLLSINDDRQNLLGLIKYWREECFRYKKENEAYENMRLEINSYICNNSQYDENIDDCWVRTNKLIEIIDKVGGDNE